MEIISRDEAIAKGLKKYFTGIPCKYGHIAERRIGHRGGECVTCKSNYNKSDKFRLWRKNVYDINPVVQEKRRQDSKKPENIAKNRAYRQSRKGTQRHKELVKKYNDSKRKTVKFKEWYTKYIKDPKVKERKRIYNATYEARRKKEDLNYRLMAVLRQRVTSAIKKNLKGGSAVRDLGCSISDFKEYIAKQFEPGMSWENWGKYTWHLDHKKPLASFDLTNREQFLQACHYTNYQPLWAEENYRKNAKLDWPVKMEAA